jgi:hypothetical protein
MQVRIKAEYEVQREELARMREFAGVPGGWRNSSQLLLVGGTDSRRASVRWGGCHALEKGVQEEEEEVEGGESHALKEAMRCSLEEREWEGGGGGEGGIGGALTVRSAVEAR